MYKDNHRRILYFYRNGDYKKCFEEIESIDFNSCNETWLISLAVNICYYFSQIEKIKTIKEIILSREKLERKNLLKEIEFLLGETGYKRNNRMHLVENVKFVPQVGCGCLPSSLAIVLNYINSSFKNGREYYKELKTDLRETGTSIYELFKFLLTNKYTFYPFTADHEIILRLLDDNIPLISMQKSSLYDDREHARVLIGYEEERLVYYFLDPLRGKIFIPFNINKELAIENNKNLYVIVANDKDRVPNWFKEYVEDNLEYHNLMGIAYDDINDVILAEEHFKKAMLIDSIYPDLLNNYAILLSKDSNRISEAIGLAIKAIKYSNGEEEYRETLNYLKKKER